MITATNIHQWIHHIIVWKRFIFQITFSDYGNDFALVSHVKPMMAAKMCARERKESVLVFFSLFCLHSLFAYRIFFPHFLRNSSCRFAQVGKINATEQKYITFTKAKRTLTHSLTHSPHAIHNNLCGYYIWKLKVVMVTVMECGPVFLCLIIIFARNA